MAKTKLELTWPGKEERPRLEPRILLEHPERGHHAATRREGDLFDNMLIKGDNLLALKALEQDYAEKIGCVYIDPPYNSDAAFGDYDDNMEHSIWLSLMKPRLELLWRLLSPDHGVILISVNDDEAHYLKVLCDELFGRSSFVTSMVWHYEGNTDNQAKIINYHEYVLVYSKSGDIRNPGVYDPNVPDGSKLQKDEIRNTIVKNGPKNPIKDVTIPRGFPVAISKGIISPKLDAWPKYDGNITVDDGLTTAAVVASSGWSSRDQLLQFIANDFKPVKDTKGQETRFEITATGAIEAIKKRDNSKGHVVSVLRGFGTTNQMRIMLDKIGVKFSYPKPVELIAYLIRVFSSPDDIILDSFAGSGTTGHAVLKLNKETGSRRRFILVELSERTADQILVPRLKAVVDGAAAADIPAHGGGFRYYTLAPSLLERDAYDNWVIAPEYNGPMLAQAMCKHLGFTYDPAQSDDGSERDAEWWRHGRSSETDFLYVTTQALTHDALRLLSDEVGPNRSLLVCARAFSGSIDGFENLTCRKIPSSILNKCEWGRDDYSLNVAALPERQITDDTADLGPLFAGEPTHG